MIFSINQINAPKPAVLEGMLQNLPCVANMIDKDKELEALLSDYDQTEVVILAYGEEKEF